jgi:hypothetical protein
MPDAAKMPGNPHGGLNSDLGWARRFVACPNRKADRLYGIMLSTMIASR